MKERGILFPNLNFDKKEEERKKKQEEEKRGENNRMIREQLGGGTLSIGLCSWCLLTHEYFLHYSFISGIIANYSTHIPTYLLLWLYSDFWEFPNLTLISSSVTTLMG